MFLRTYTTFSRPDVKSSIKRVLSASTPITTLSTREPHRRSTPFLITTPQHRYISIYAPEVDTVKSKPKSRTLKTSARLTTYHYDLNSFLAYQNAKGVNTDTTVALGTRYEYLIQRHLQDKLGFSLTRIGGKGDGGIDLIGTWTIPNFSASSPSLTTSSGKGTTFRILIQAKRLSSHRKPMPSLMRELEGTLESSSSTPSITQAFQHHLSRKREEQSRNSTVWSSAITPIEETIDTSLTTLPTLAILITTNALTDGIRKLMSSSRSTLMYMCMQEDAPNEHSEDMVPSTSTQQIAWNEAAAQAGLEGLNVGMRYADRDTSRSGLSGAGSHPAAAASKEAVLLYDGRPVQFASAHQLPLAGAAG